MLKSILYADKVKTSALISNRGLQLPKLVQSLSDVSSNIISNNFGRVEAENVRNSKQRKTRKTVMSGFSGLKKWSG